MKCRVLPPAVFQPAGAEGSAPGGSEGAVEACLKMSRVLQQVAELQQKLQAAQEEVKQLKNAASAALPLPSAQSSPRCAC